MKVRILAAAAAAVMMASCSGGIYDTSDFMTARRTEADPAAATPNPANPDTPVPDTAAAEAPATPAGEPPAATASAEPGPGAPDDPATAAAPSAPATAAAPSAPATAVAEVSAAPRGLLSMFRSVDPANATPEAQAVTSTAAAGATPIARKVAAAADAPIESGLEEEVSEADLAGEEEADPTEIAPVEVPFDDGEVHDFVNVYTSRPDKPVEVVEGLPGVTWKDGIVLVSRTPDDDPSGFFDGPLHPFARTVPGVPRQTVQAANGLLLAHSAINVSCIKPGLLALVRRAESHFGKKVVVTSGYRSPSHNRRVRGARHSQHMACNALDLYMPGVARDDLARYFYAQADRGGIGIYCHTRSIHVDTGKRRQWRWPCRGRRG